MYSGKKVLGVITARGGSKGIPKKNIKELGGKPLIVWTIAAAQQSQFLTDFLVSTDDQEIADVCVSVGASVPFLRPPELSTDAAKSIPVIQHAIQFQKDLGKEYDYVMILQPTSPFRTAADIDACITKIVDTGADSVMSMVKLVDFSVAKLKQLDVEDRILPLAESEGTESKSRHDLEGVYKRNCAIYLSRVSCLMNNDLFGADSRAYVMPDSRSVDINVPLDLVVAQALVSEQK